MCNLSYALRQAVLLGELLLPPLLLQLLLWLRLPQFFARRAACSCAT